MNNQMPYALIVTFAICLINIECRAHSSWLNKNLLITTSTEGTRIINTQTKKSSLILKNESFDYATMSNNTNIAALINDNNLIILDPLQNTIFKRIKILKGTTALIPSAFANKGESILLQTTIPPITCYTIDWKRSDTIYLHKKDIIACPIAGKNKRISILDTPSGTLQVIDTDNNKVINTLESSTIGGIDFEAMSPDQTKIVFTDMRNNILIWHYTRRPLVKLQTTEYPLDITNDLRHLLTKNFTFHDGTSSDKLTFSVWDMEKGHKQFSVNTETSKGDAIFGWDGERLATGCVRYNTYNINNGELLFSTTGQTGHCLLKSLPDKIVAENQNKRVIDIATGKTLNFDSRYFSSREHCSGEFCALYSDNLTYTIFEDLNRNTKITNTKTSAVVFGTNFCDEHFIKVVAGEKLFMTEAWALNQESDLTFNRLYSLSTHNLIAEMPYPFRYNHSEKYIIARTYNGHIEIWPTDYSQWPIEVIYSANNFAQEPCINDESP